MLTNLAGWRVVHCTDRVVELRKESAVYRRFTERDGYVRLRGEPGLDRQFLLDKALTMAQRNDEDLAQRVAKQLMPQKLQKYQIEQKQWARVYGTPEDPEMIGVKRP